MTVEVPEDFNIDKFQADLLNWYHTYKRDLPWRKDQDPYKVWVSEIMLQQTKVDTVIPYFNHFIEKYPTIHDLAEAEEQDVLKAWEGLGYYSRAKNLQEAVREVDVSYGGQVPDDPQQLASLKGVGPYTKGAILSIAYDQPEPAVDGNVMRVFSRLLKIDENIALQKTKKHFEKYIRHIISKEDPSSFNQAIMDLGAMVCTPKSPACLLCPVQAHCKAFAEGVQEKLPIKTKAKKQKKVPYAAILIRNKQHEYVIEQRPDSGLLANLWQFPMVPLDKIDFEHAESWLLNEYGLDIEICQKKGELKHVFSHLIWEIEIYDAKTKHTESKDTRLRFVRKEALKEYPFPVSHQKMMQYLDDA